MNGYRRERRSWQYGCFALFYIFYLWIAAQIPYSYDDWLWAMPEGIQDWLHGWSNSRYVGNFFELLMCYSELMKILVMGTGTLLTSVMVMKIAADTTQIHDPKQVTICFVCSNLLLLCINRFVWQQTYGWVAGFANFSLSGVFMLACMWQMLPFLGDTRVVHRHPVLHGFFLFFLGLCGQLLVENVSIFMVLFALATCVVSYLRTKTLSPQLLAITAGILIGVVIMFSSSFYATLFTTGQAIGDYRQLPVLSQGGLVDMVIYCIRETMVMFVWIWRKHWNMAVVILLLMSILVVRVKEHQYARLRWPLVVLNCVLAVFFVVNDLWAFVLPTVVVTAFDILFFLGMGLQFWLVFRADRTRVYQMIALWLSVVAVMAPLAPTSERRDRLFLAPFVVLLLICGILILEVLKKNDRLLRRIAVAVCVVGTVASMSKFGIAYGQIGADRAQRKAILAEAIQTEAKTVVLPRYRHEEYLSLQDPDPETGWGIEIFKVFYGLDPDVTIVIQ